VIEQMLTYKTAVLLTQLPVSNPQNITQLTMSPVTLCAAFATNMPHPAPTVNKNNPSKMYMYLCSSLLDLVARTRPG